MVDITMEERIRFGQAINLAYAKLNANKEVCETNEDLFILVMRYYESISFCWEEFQKRYVTYQKKIQEIEEEMIPEVDIAPDETYVNDEILEEEPKQEYDFGEDD